MLIAKNSKDGNLNKIEITILSENAMSFEKAVAYLNEELRKMQESDKEEATA